MGLLLCEKGAARPLYYEKLDTNLWSLQELCYVIFRYPVLVPEDFVDRKLCAWLKDELGLSALSERLEQLLASEAAQEDMLFAILQEGNYYTSAELGRYRSESKRLRSLPYAAFAELLGDSFYQMGRYGKAIKAYQDARTDQEKPQLLEKLAAAYVHVMQLERAAALYEEVYQKTGAQTALRQLYMLSRMEPSLERAARCAKKVGEEQRKAWDEAFSAAAAGADASARVKQVEQIFSGARRAVRAEAEKLIVRWKQEYREKA